MSWLPAIARCPRCAAPRRGQEAPFRCAACGLVLFANPAVGVGAFVRRADGRVLFTVRAKDPGRGMLGLPGGFVDAGEDAEAALAREVREEIGGALAAVRYLCSAPNRYAYAGIDYDVLDLFFAAELAPGELRADADEVSGMLWLMPGEVEPARIAFPSMRTAWAAWLRAQA
jgi:ADP-ribose pyrophosphatase YjhB (NUDIX family)